MGYNIQEISVNAFPGRGRQATPELVEVYKAVGRMDESSVALKIEDSQEVIDKLRTSLSGYYGNKETKKKLGFDVKLSVRRESADGKATLYIKKVRS